MFSEKVFTAVYCHFFITDTFGDLIKGNCSQYSGGGGWLLTVFGWLLLGDTSILATRWCRQGLH